MEKIPASYENCPECAERPTTHLLAWVQDQPVSGLKGWCVVCLPCAQRIQNGPATTTYARHDFVLVDRVDRG